MPWTAAGRAALAHGGQVCVACAATRSQTPDQGRALARGAADAGRQVLITARVGPPPDYPARPGFPESRYLKFVVLQAE